MSLHSCSSTPPIRVTPPPCTGVDPSACPYYWKPVESRFYQVELNGIPSYVYQSELPSACADGSYKCARDWDVKSQSFTSASADFSGGCPVTVTVHTQLAGGRGRLSHKEFRSPTVASRFGVGRPVEVSTTAGEYVFNVTAAGQYSIELFGQDALFGQDELFGQDALADALLVFIDDAPSKDAAHAEGCGAPALGGRQYRFSAPGVVNPTTPSWTPHSTGYPTGYYALDTLTIGAGDAVCVERGAVVEGYFASSGPCTNHNARVEGGGIISGKSATGYSPKDDRRPLLQLCGQNVTVKRSPGSCAHSAAP